VYIYIHPYLTESSTEYKKKKNQKEAVLSWLFINHL